MIALAALAAAAGAQPDISESELEDLLRVKVRTVQHMALNPLLIRAVRQQNVSGLTPEEIARRDKAWRATKELTPFKLSLQTSPAGRFLRGQIQRSTSFNEAFLTDNRGANVAAFPATSDYWQGDEDKWIDSFNGGNGRIYIGALELDESTNTVAAQVSAPVLDRGKTIGVLVVGVTINYLQTKRQ
ncbi:MAG: hypothetical protein BMS9Abin01_1368 [Gammaproteobacteria bacterium]|nr:MAG: hypothetical protein BMS9Abin01_1368 [Gammaproteobacteria bacterium]